MVTRMQKELLELAQKQNITLLLAQTIYSSHNSAKDALTHLTLRKFLKCNYGVYSLTEEGKKYLENDRN